MPSRARPAENDRMSTFRAAILIVGVLLALVGAVAGVTQHLPSDYWQQPLAPQGEVPRAWMPEERSLTPQSCGVCHAGKLEEWRTSLHAKAFSPGLIGQLLTYDAEEAAACLQCHAPMAEQRKAFETARRTGNAPLGIDWG